jgi:hypothetical protein
MHICLEDLYVVGCVRFQRIAYVRAHSLCNLPRRAWRCRGLLFWLHVCALMCWCVSTFLCMRRRYTRAKPSSMMPSIISRCLPARRPRVVYQLAVPRQRATAVRMPLTGQRCFEAPAPATSGSVRSQEACSLQARTGAAEDEQEGALGLSDSAQGQRATIVHETSY